MKSVEQEAPRPARGALRLRPFYVHIGTVFVVLMLAIVLGLGAIARYETRRMILQSADQLFSHVGSEVSLQLRLLRGPVELAVQAGAAGSPLIHATTFAARMARVAPFTTTLDLEPQIAAMYLGYNSGDFFLVRPLRTEAARAAFKAPAGSAYLVQSLEYADSRVRWVALSAELTVLAEWSPPGAVPDPRTQPAYRAAMGTDRLVRTAPYVLATTGELGRTTAMRDASGTAVIAADLLKDTVGDALAKLRVTPSTELAVFDADGILLAFHDTSKVSSRAGDGLPIQLALDKVSPVMAWVGREKDRLGSPRTVSIDGRDWNVHVTPLLTGASQDYLAIAAPLDELMAEVSATQHLLLVLMLVAIGLAVPVTWTVSKRIAGQLNDLAAQAAAIRRFDFKTDYPVQTSIREIRDLADVMNRMKATIQRFLDVSSVLASERNFQTLMGRVIDEVRLVAGADGGTVYLFDDDAQLLTCAAERWSGDGAVLVGAGAPVSIEDLAHPIAAAARNPEAPTTVVLSGRRPAGFEPLDTRYGSKPVELVVIPLRTRTQSLVGVVCAFVAPGSPAPSPERITLLQPFAAVAAVAIDQQRLLQAQKDLLNALVSLVAGAIDAKSPYTGGHCQRVPELTEMLARAAHESAEAPFHDFSLDDEGWEALRLAAWLHDCGKVTTPEYVVDKATRLETLYDRIHEIRMRFEVLKRDAEIAMLKAVQAGGEPAALAAALRDEWRSLDEAFAFVASCNEGGAFMSREKLERLDAIAGRTWQRTLDDRIGISRDERRRKETSAPAPLPATESVLADKPEHVIERDSRELIGDDNPWGFRLTVPKALYNRGELYNLRIGRGTLTEEERYKINDHVVQSIVMLSQLPFPRHLKGVADLAGAHHEKMDGTGYPRRLRREDMSVPARIMAIADIFEALTATDRPYKPGKKLSEAVKIMGMMVTEQHIDPDLFALFLRSGVYRQYAERYLPPELIDDVDISPYLGGAAPALR